MSVAAFSIRRPVTTIMFTNACPSSQEAMPWTSFIMSSCASGV